MLRACDIIPRVVFPRWKLFWVWANLIITLTLSHPRQLDISSTITLTMKVSQLVTETKFSSTSIMRSDPNPFHHTDTNPNAYGESKTRAPTLNTSHINDRRYASHLNTHSLGLNLDGSMMKRPKRPHWWIFWKIELMAHLPRAGTVDGVYRIAQLPKGSGMC